jgi:hypothetical protein
VTLIENIGLRTFPSPYNQEFPEIFYYIDYNGLPREKTSA